jgi:transcriptional regulator with XRE-family HTH domain
MVNLAFLVRRRLKELNIDQRDLAVAAQVTESYISQLLSSKKAPPDPNRNGHLQQNREFPQLGARRVGTACPLTAQGGIEAARRRTRKPLSSRNSGN